MRRRRPERGARCWHAARRPRSVGPDGHLVRSSDGAVRTTGLVDSQAELSVADLLVARAEDDHPGLRFEDQQWSWRQVVAASAARADLIRSLPAPALSTSACSSATSPSTSSGWARPPWPARWWSGSTRPAGARRWPATSGAPTAGGGHRRRRGPPARRPRPRCRPPTGSSGSTTPAYRRPVGASTRAPTPGRSSPAGRPHREDLYLLLFTSGTTGAPKAVRCTQGRLASIAERSAEAYGFDRDDVAYCTMPLFHGNALMVLWGPSLVVGATVALARRFSASGFVADVRRYGATTFTYVGKALAYVLATPAGRRTMPRSPCAAGSAPRRPWPTTPNSSGGSDACSPRGTDRARVGWPSPGRRTPRSGSLGRPTGDIAIVDPDDRRGVPAGRFRRRRSAASTATWPSARSSTGRASAGSRGTTPTRRRPRPGPGTAGTGRGTWPTATRPASSTSPVGGATGCGWTPRT